MPSESVFHFKQSDDPGAVGAGKYWIRDTDAAHFLIYRRNETNAAWVLVGGLSAAATQALIDATNPMNAKGDLLTRSAFNLVRQPVGSTDGEILIADSTVSTGLNWRNVNTLIASQADPSFVALTPPIDANFAWVNQGSATIDTSNGGIYVSGPATAGVDLHIRVMTAPATPYVVTALFMTNMPAETSGVVGLIFRQSSDGKIATCVVSQTSGFLRGQSTKYTNPTTFSAVYQNVALPSYQRIWLRIADNGTNRICSYSYDGIHFKQFHSVTRTDFLTANQIGFAIDSNNATYGSDMWLLSWKIT